MAFSWSEDLVLGENRVDNQHKEVFRILNTLLNAMDYGKGKDAIGSVLEFLANYIKYLIDEEKLMAAHNYNDYLPQTVEHIQFIKDFFCLKRKFETSGATLHLVVETQQRLGNWVTNHIKTQDKKWGIFLKTK